MEVIAFDTKDVENKLQDIKSALQVLFYAINGLKNFDVINNDELSGFEYVISDAKRKSDVLIKGMQPVWVDAGDKIMILMGEEE